MTPAPHAPAPTALDSTLISLAPQSALHELALAPTPEGLTAGGVPACVHDPRAWHGLVERNADGSIRCTYGHEHKDNPSLLDAVFGPLPSYLGGAISYPWQTQNASTGALENDAKHRVYDWQVIDLPCRAQGANGLSFSRVRAEYHADGNSGAAVRFHSYWLQAETCDPQNASDRGIIETGGHLDYGSLYLDPPGGPRVYVPLPGDKGANSDDQRNHGSVDQPRLDFTWYGSNRYPAPAGTGPKLDVRVGIHKEDWGPIDPSNPTATLFYGGSANGSFQEPLHLLTMQFGYDFDGLDGRLDGRATWTGYTDRAGAVVQGCTAPSTDCVPLRLQNVRVGVEYQFRADAFGDLTREYNVNGPDGQSLLRYPN